MPHQAGEGGIANSPTPPSASPPPPAPALPPAKRLNRLSRALPVDRVQRVGLVPRRPVVVDQPLRVEAEAPPPGLLGPRAANACLQAGQQAVQHVAGVKAVDPVQLCGCSPYGHDPSERWHATV